MSLSITEVGGRRPAWPTTVGAIAPVPVSVTVGPVISVRVRLADVAPPARNSATRPDTVTASPGSRPAAGGSSVKTKMPSDVRTSASGSGSWT